MKLPIWSYAILALVIVGVCGFAVMALTQAAPPHHPKAARLVAHGIFVDVQRGTIYASDFISGWDAQYNDVEFQWGGNLMEFEWVHELPITCEDLGTQIIVLRKTGDSSIIVETYVVIQDNYYVCEEAGP